MPPSNSPADTPVQSNSLPPLLHYHSPVEEPERTDNTRNTGSRTQTSTSTSLLPHISTAINQQLVPLLPLPLPSATIYNQLPPPPALQHGQDNDIRLRRNVPRRAVGRDSDPRLATTRIQDYGPRIPSITPAQPETLYDWAPAPAGQMYFAGTVEPSNTIRQDGESVSRSHFGRLQQYTSPPLAPSVRSRPRDLRHYEHLAPAVASQDNSSNRPFSASRRYVRSQPQRSRNIGAVYAAEAERDRERLRQRDRDRGHYADNAEMAADDIWPAIRRSYIYRRNHRSSMPPIPREELEETLKYLAKLRGCITMGESLRLALTFGFTRDASWLSFDGCECTYDDFLLDTRMLNVPRTSWLDIGGTFWGSQTTLSTSSTTERYSPSRWTVKVNISGVDYDTLRLNGTMEAYADWAKHADQASTSASSSESSSTPSSPASVHYYEYKNGTDSLSASAGKDLMTPIVTYLEGEIIDFQTHTLETTSFTSTIRDDALYWRKLEPFVNLDADTLVQSLTSKRFMKQLMQDYVLMRWKEKCFIKGEKGSTNDSGTESITGGTIGGAGLLTIGGFYFVSMKRSDGQIRGYYYDPLSTPYQELVLKPKKRVFPTYEFR
ncbi:vacuolar import and degradation protein-domain-containing protein [Peziza echinospora]|nr:vacuolar import and degradation protein-domain-containing protein [Peziza echinospora]